jgi:hypothetical protein
MRRPIHERRQIDSLFRTAVVAIDNGDTAELERLIADTPALVRDRLRDAGPWLRAQVGDALDGFFRDPYLLWFVAEDPVRNGKLPPNIADVARTIIEAARREGVATMQEQLDYALRLVCWSWIARECDVQIALIDVFVDAGASLDGAPDNALVNDNTAAAAHLIERGAPLTLAVALALGQWDDARRIAGETSPREKQGALILSALRGNARALRIMIDVGADINAVSPDLYSHATALHHAVWSGSLDAVKTLVEAGADTLARDSMEDATPLGWAEYAQSGAQSDRARLYAEIVAYLRTVVTTRPQ